MYFIETYYTYMRAYATIHYIYNTPSNSTTNFTSITIIIVVVVVVVVVVIVVVVVLVRVVYLCRYV